MWPKPKRMWLKTLAVVFHLTSLKAHSLAVQLFLWEHSLLKWRQELDGVKKASWWNPCPAKSFCEVLVLAVRATIDKNRIRREAHCIQFRCRLSKGKGSKILPFLFTLSFPPVNCSVEKLETWIIDLINYNRLLVFHTIQAQCKLVWPMSQTRPLYLLSKCLTDILNFSSYRFTDSFGHAGAAQLPVSQGSILDL